MSKFDKKSPKGSVPNWRLQICNHYAIRWFKCKLKPPKNRASIVAADTEISFKPQDEMDETQNPVETDTNPEKPNKSWNSIVVAEQTPNLSQMPTSTDSAQAGHITTGSTS